MPAAVSATAAPPKADAYASGGQIGGAGAAWSGVSWTQEPAGDWPDLAEIKALAWLVFDRSTGASVLAHNADQVLYPASTTKIMTAILALETLSPDQTATVSAAAVNLTSGSSKIGLKAGETLVVRDLLAGLMLASGNDAANVLAEAMDGSLEQFALRMNAKAAAIGMTQSNFCNPSGLHDDAHVSTARDLVRLADYAMNNDHFREIAALKTYIMPATGAHPYLGWAMLVNSNRLIQFDDALLQTSAVSRYTGIKTGTTYYAGGCLVASAELADGRELIAVVLGVPSNFDAGSPFSVAHTLIRTAAGQLLPDEQPQVTEPSRPAESTTEAVQTPTPAITRETEATTEATGSVPRQPDSDTEGGLAGFLRHNPWRTAFIVLAICLIVLYIWVEMRAYRLRAKRKARRRASIQPRRDDRP